MDDARIRGLSRKVTLERIAEFTGLRMKRQRDGRLYVILAPSKDDCPDGPSGAAWHSSVRSAQDAMAIAYSFPSLRPVFYRPLRGCDPRALNDLCGKLSGLINGGHVSLYEDADDASLSPLLDSGLPFVARVSPYKEPAIGCLMGMKWDDAGMPVDMTWDEGGGFYVGRFPVEGWGHAGTCGRKGVGDPQETSCVLVLDVERRAQELAMVTRALVAERRLLDSLRTGAPSPLPGPAMAGLRYHVVRVGEDEAGRSVIQEIKVDDRKVKTDRAVCGFTTFVTRRSADDARDALRIHGAYKRQVRYASCSTDCLAWPRNGEADDLLLFASFVGLTIDNALQGAIDRANGHMDGIETPGDVLDEMYDIRWTGGSDGAGRMGPLLDSQKRVAAALGLEG